jgi:hypothetical protein
MKIGRLVRAVGELKKIFFKLHKKRQQRYISRVCGGGILQGGTVKLGTFVDVLDFMNHAKFHLRKMSISRASRGQKRICL